jgi:hypothetical protein
MKNSFIAFILTFVSCLVWGQTVPTITVSPTTPAQKPTMSSYLNGISRNHFNGFKSKGIPSLADSLLESRFDDKTRIYRNIQNSFATTGGGKNVYRLGHNISDGNFDYQIASYNVSQPGWHWASKYLSDGNQYTVFNTNSPINDSVGAGIHRYFFLQSDPRKLQLPINTNYNYPDVNFFWNNQSVLNSDAAGNWKQFNFTYSGFVSFQLFAKVNVPDTTTVGGIRVWVNNGSGWVILKDYPGRGDNYLKINFTTPAGTNQLAFQVYKTAGSQSISASEWNLSEQTDRYSGYAARVNYNNNATTGLSCPKSKVFTLPTQNFGTLDLASVDTLLPTTPDEFVQIGGPKIAVGSKLSVGIYEIDFRIMDTTTKDIAYCGYVVSVNPPADSSKLIRLQDDIDLLISSPSTANASNNASTILGAHRKLISSIKAPRVAKKGTPEYNSKNEQSIYSSTTAIDTSRHFLPATYDAFEHYLREADSLNANLAIVLNIATGYPEEAEGLLAYLKARTKNVAYVELGSELMGFWNKGSGYDLYYTPQKLGQGTYPFANKIKSSTVPGIASTKIATTSTYNFLLEFWNFDTIGSPNYVNNQISGISDRVDKWLDALTTPGGTLLVDYLNIHNYPMGELAQKNFVLADVNGIVTFKNPEKVKDLLAVNEAFGTTIMDSILVGVAKNTGRTIGFVLTESNSADRSYTAPVNLEQHLTMTEGLFYAESFLMSAKRGFEAMTPFALMRTVFQDNSDGTYSASSSPTDPNFKIHDALDFDVLFYPNNKKKFSSPNVYFKPTFRVKKMISENLSKLIYTHTYTGGTPKIDTLGEQYTKLIVQSNQFGVLATKATANANEYRILVINRALPDGTNTKDPLFLKIGNQNIIGNVQIMSLAGDDITDKDPAVSVANGTLQKGKSLLEPVFTNASLLNGAIEVPKFSVNILKVTLSSTPTLTISDTTVNENAGTAQVKVYITPASTVPITLSYSTANGSAIAGTDYSTTNSTPSGVTIPANTTVYTISIPIIDDFVADNPATKSFSVNLGNVSSGAILGDAQADVNIVDNESAQNLCALVSALPIANGISITSLPNSAPLQIKIQPLPGLNTVVLDTILPTPPSNFLLTGLSNGSYRVLVTAYAPLSCSKQIDVVVGTPNPCSPDVTAPTINSCPTNKTATSTTGNPVAVTWVAPTASDVCNGTVSLMTSHASGSSFPVGTTTVNYTASDVSGNTAICNFTVTVTGPSASCTGNLLSNQGFQSGIFSPWQATTATILATGGNTEPRAASLCSGSGRIYQNYVHPGGNTTYVFKAFLKRTAAAASASLTIKYLDAGWVPLSSVTTPVSTLTTSFTQQSVQAVTPALTKYVEVSISHTSGTGCVIADDACLVTTTSVTLPNLKVSILTQPQIVLSGTSPLVALEYQVQNQSVNVTTGFSVQIFKSATQTLDGSAAIYTKNYASGMAIGTASSEWAFMNTTPASYYIVVVDPLTSGNPNGLIAEADETDNAIASTVQARVSHLIMEKESELPDAEIIAYPNPATSFLLVSLGSYAEKELTISLIDVIGAVKKQQHGTFPNQALFNVDDLTPGIYFLRVDGKGIRSKTLKVVVESGR